MRARGAVVVLPTPIAMHRLRRLGLRGFEAMIQEYLHVGSMNLEEAAEFRSWARTYVAHRATIKPTPALQRAWVQEGARRRARLVLRHARPIQVTTAAAASNDARAL